MEKINLKLELLDECLRTMQQLRDTIQKEMIMKDVSEFILSVEANDPEYYQQLKKEGVLFTDFEEARTFRFLEVNMCFENAKKISVNSGYKYFEGIAKINGNILEHAINVDDDELAYDFTSCEFGNNIEWFFGCKDIIRNNPLLTLQNLSK
jgi:hypothetical protein